MPIPKIMHFIWVGNTIPEDRLQIIKEWYTKYSEFEIYFWIDKQGTTESFGLDKCNEQREKLCNAGIDLNKLKIKDIGEEFADDSKKLSMEIIRYEIDRLRPNYGAASDLIRYEALCKYGGVYIDSDVLPPTTQNTSIYCRQTFWNETDCCYAYRVEVDSSWTLNTNDIIFSPPNSDGMRNFIKHVQENYNVKYRNPNSLLVFQQVQEAISCVQAYNYSTNHYIKESTKSRTGPLVMAYICREDNGIKYIEDILIIESQIRVPLVTSAASWLGLRPKSIDDPNLVIEMIMKSVNFELVHFGILRLDDHFSDLDDIFEFDEENKKNCYTELISRLSKINIKPEIIVQYPFMHKEVEVLLLKRKNWFQNTCLNLVTSDERYNNRAIVSVLSYLESCIDSDAENIRKREEKGKDTSALTVAFNKQLTITLKFINCFLSIVNEKNLDEKTLSETNRLVDCISKYIDKSSMTSEIQSSLEKAKKNLGSLSSFKEAVSKFEQITKEEESKRLGLQEKKIEQEQSKMSYEEAVSRVKQMLSGKMTRSLSLHDLTKEEDSLIRRPINHTEKRKAKTPQNQKPWRR